MRHGEISNIYKSGIEGEHCNANDLAKSKIPWIKLLDLHTCNVGRPTGEKINATRKGTGLGIAPFTVNFHNIKHSNHQ